MLSDAVLQAHCCSQAQANVTAGRLYLCEHTNLELHCRACSSCLVQAPRYLGPSSHPGQALPEGFLAVGCLLTCDITEPSQGVICVAKD